MYSDVVCEVDKELFEAKLTELKTAKGYESDLDITADDFENTIIPHDLGTAVNVQQMVFGNMGDDSGTGVLFTRNAANGDNHIYGEYLINAQGEDVVAGIRTPQKIAKLEEDMPESEFTVENGKLYILQTRNGKRTGKAALKIAVDLVHEGLINKYEAMTRVEPDQISQLLHPNFTSAALAAAEVLIEGLPASPGAGAGKVYLTAEKVHEQAVAGEKVILVRHETSPEDIQGMVDCEGILTSTGGMTSHAAVVARGMGKCKNLSRRNRNFIRWYKW